MVRKKISAGVQSYRIMDRVCSSVGNVGSG